MELYISNELNSEDQAYIAIKMFEYNAKHVPEHLKGRYQEVQLFLKNRQGQIVGGMISEICWNWLEVRYLFVDEAVRTLGYGAALLKVIGGCIGPSSKEAQQ